MAYLNKKARGKVNGAAGCQAASQRAMILVSSVKRLTADATAWHAA
jgi:hypothetical protein